MADNKKYYWLKLKDDFFKDIVIKKLRKIAGGDTYTIIYLKLLLLSLKNEGKLYFEGVEETFAEEMALELDEDADNVSVTLNYLQKNSLIEMVDSDEFFLTETKSITGQEAASTLRSRRHRAKKALQCNADATPMQRLGNKNVTPEKEIRERDKNINSSNEELICSEPLASQTSDPAPAAKKPEIKFTEFKIPLVSNNPKTGQKLDYAIPKKDFDEWVTAFPAVDIAQELRKMRQWSLANPTKAKTGRGIKAFIVRWLSRAQDSGGATKKQVEVQSNGDRTTPRRMTFAEQEELLRLQGLAKLRYKIEGEAGLCKFCEDEKLDFDEVKKWI